jgi:hypothetical protein
MVATPGIPADRVKILRDAYNKALKEPELLEEAKKREMVVEPKAVRSWRPWQKRSWHNRQTLLNG